MPAKALARLVLPTPGSPSSTTRCSQQLEEAEDSEDQLPRGAAALAAGSDEDCPSWGWPSSARGAAPGTRGRGVLALLRSGLLLPGCVLRVIWGSERRPRWDAVPCSPPASQHRGHEHCPAGPAPSG